jgi:hypothetical protein
MARPNINTSPVADQHADKTTERIVEFSSGKAGGPGGLISFKQTGEDGRGLHVDVYRLDEGVSVLVEGDTTEPMRKGLVEVLALLDRLEASDQSYHLDMIRVHVPEKVREALAPDVASLNQELQSQGY